MALDYEDAIDIDVNGLDVEWVRQSKLMGDYCKHAAQCKKDVDLTKEQLEICKAGLDRQIRSDPEKFGLKKITETVVGNAVIESQTYQECQQEYIDAKFEYEMAVAAVRAVDQKKTALENLVRLHGASYFAGPSVPRDLNEEWEKKAKSKQSNSKVKIARKKKK